MYVQGHSKVIGVKHQPFIPLLDEILMIQLNVDLLLCT